MNNLQTNNKFTIGSKIRLKPSAENWSFSFYARTWEYPNEPLSLGDNTVGSYVELYPNDFELVEDKLIGEDKQRHVHYDMIVEWAANPSRVVQFRTSINYPWTDAAGMLINWHPNTEYRFKPERQFPTTSLTEDELTTLFDVTLGGVADALKAIANEAIKRYILEQENKESK